MTPGSANILVVEDDGVMRVTLADILEDQGYQVTACQSGEEGAECIRQAPPDVVIADLRLPDLNGLQLLETLKEIKPEAAFILITGHATLETAVAALNDGAFAYFTKPFNIDEVCTIIRNALRQQRLLVENQRLVENLQRLAADLARSNADLEQFAFIASHDLQEPLRKVRTFGDRLQTRYGDLLTDQGQDYLHRMLHATERMQTLIDDLLTFSRVSTKAEPFVPVDLAALAQQVLDDLEVTIEQIGGRVEVNGLPTIDAEPTQMRQLLQNLISNSLKFRREDEPPVVKIQGQLLDGPATNGAGDLREERRLKLTIQDNGIGFEEKHLERIFNLFQRLHGRSEYPGTGIGLAVCRKIAERHRGTITATSRPGHGATFIVTLPVEQPK